jgi:hypothetical protein
MDHAPQVAATTDGQVLALWQTSDGNTLIGTPTNPITLTYAWWDPNSSAWSTPAAALTNGQGIFDPAVAAHSSTLAALAYVRDLDLDLGTVTDTEIIVTFYDGNAWGTPIQVTNDSTADHSPALAYDASGKLHIFWLSGDQLMWLPDSTDVADAQSLPATGFETGILGYKVSRDTDGNLGVVWQSMDAGQADLVYSLYDSANDDWGAPQALLENTGLEAAHSPAFEPDGDLSLAYQKISITHTDQTVTISPTLTITVTGLPTAGQSDLAFSSHTMGHDLTLENLTVKPENLSAGETITVTVVLRNHCDWTAPAPQVGFYVDDALLGPVQTLPDLHAGFTTTVQIQWTFPVTTTPQAIVAKADPADSLTETDENNNRLSTTVPQPDLAVNRFYAEVDDDELILTALVENLAAFDSTLPFSVTFRLGNPYTGTQIATTWLGTVGAGAIVTVTVSIDDPGSLSGNRVWVIIDPTNQIAELDEQNNLRPAIFTVEIWRKIYLPLIQR